MPPDNSQPSINVWRLLLKVIVLFAVVNLLYMLVDPLPATGRLSAYNRIFPGRLRLPYGDVPQHSYNLSLYNLEAMFASHELAAGLKAAGEFRVIIIGDSSTWGFLLQPDETLAARLNSAGLSLPDGRRLRAYNLGYPVMSVAKDLVILSYAMRYQPDLIVWPVTLESLPYDKQLFPPLLQHNPQVLSDLVQRYELSLDLSLLPQTSPAWWQRTLIGERRELADLLRLQAYGVLWAATGIDQDIPAEFTPRQEDLTSDLEFHNLQPPLNADDLAFDVLSAGKAMAGNIPILLVNEPMFVSTGQNSDLRYNFFYPRWVYDSYLVLMENFTKQHGWHYLDAWDAVAPDEFTNTAIHMTPRGTAHFANLIGREILEMIAAPAP